MTAKNSVLVVEDDEAIRESLVEFLEDHGYHPMEAHHGQEALQLLAGAAERPGLIVLDLMMPIMDGHAFREEQLRDPELSKIPVVVISAYRDVDDRAVALNLPHIKKPLDMRELLRMVERHCGGEEPRPA
jgi:CheY-like chemotaxis protein